MRRRGRGTKTEPAPKERARDEKSGHVGTRANGMFTLYANKERQTGEVENDNNCYVTRIEIRNKANASREKSGRRLFRLRVRWPNGNVRPYVHRDDTFISETDILIGD